MARWMTGLIAALCLAGVAGCDKKPPPPLVAGAQTWAGNEPAFLARDLNFLPADSVRVNEYATLAEVREAFRKDAVQLAAFPLPDALLLLRDMPELKIVLLADARADKTLDVWVIRDDDIGRFHRELQAVFAGWQQAIDYEKNNAAKALALEAAREHLAAAPMAQALAGIERYDMAKNRDLMLGEAPGIAASIDSAERDLMNKGKLQVGAEAVTLIDTTLLSESAEKK
jgi:hypothetical protein